MLATNSPEVPAAIRVRLDNLRRRKDFLDRMIEAVERYVQFVAAEGMPGSAGMIREPPVRCRKASGAEDRLHGAA
jgi:hypothetical protein